MGAGTQQLRSPELEAQLSSRERGTGCGEGSLLGLGEEPRGTEGTKAESPGASWSLAPSWRHQGATQGEKTLVPQSGPFSRKHTASCASLSRSGDNSKKGTLGVPRTESQGSLPLLAHWQRRAEGEELKASE